MVNKDRNIETVVKTIRLKQVGDIMDMLNTQPGAAPICRVWNYETRSYALPDLGFPPVFYQIVTPLNFLLLRSFHQRIVFVCHSHLSQVLLPPTGSKHTVCSDDAIEREGKRAHLSPSTRAHIHCVSPSYHTETHVQWSQPS